MDNGNYKMQGENSWFTSNFKKDELSIQKKIEESLFHLNNDKLQKAIESLQEIIKMDFENESVISLIKYLSFWKERIEVLSKLSGKAETGNYLMQQWLVFIDFIKSINLKNEIYFFVIKRYIFQKALEYYIAILNESPNEKENPDLLMKIGRCLKNKGNYEKAIEYFQEASSLSKDNPEILSELADCLAIVDDENTAKLFFREAFFMDPIKIKIEFLESMMFKKLYESTSNMISESGVKINQELILEWIPVYGVILGVFSVKRELKPMDYSRLINNVRLLEKDYQTTGNEIKKHNEMDERVYFLKNRLKTLIPKLLNKYFWLIDHYINKKEDRSKIEEILLKIKTLDSKIHYMYTK